MPQTICVFGHSHVWSVRRNVNQPIADGFEFQAPLCGTKEMPGPLVYFQGEKQRPHLTPVLVALLNRLTPSPDLWLLSMVQGNYYNQLGMLTSGQPFDFIDPGEPEAPFDETALHLPYGAVKAAVERQMANLTHYLRRLKVSDFSEQMLIAGTPPPPRDTEVFKPMLEEKGLMAELTPPHVRLKLWRLQDEIYARMSDEAGLRYVSAAMTHAQDGDGYLLPEYVKDAVHANGPWAALYLKKVAEEVTAIRESRNV